MRSLGPGWMAVAAMALATGAAAQSSPPKATEPGAADAVMRDPRTIWGEHH